MTFINSRDTKGKLSEDKQMSGSSMDKSNMTYEILMKMVNNPVYDLLEVEMA